MKRTMLVRVGAIALSTVLVGGCAGLRNRSDAPCFDGWSVTPGVGSSNVWRPSSLELNQVSAALGDRSKIACIHQMPGGEILVITGRRGRLRTTEMVLRDGTYVITDVGVIVTAD